MGAEGHERLEALTWVLQPLRVGKSLLDAPRIAFHECQQEVRPDPVGDAIDSRGHNRVADFKPESGGWSAGRDDAIGCRLGVPPGSTDIFEVRINCADPMVNVVPEVGLAAGRLVFAAEQAVEIRAAPGFGEMNGEVTQPVAAVRVGQTRVRGQPGKSCSQSAELRQEVVGDPAVRGRGGLPKIHGQLPRFIGLPHGVWKPAVKKFLKARVIDLVPAGCVGNDGQEGSELMVATPLNARTIV
jgi:hypothetical protein